MEKNILLLLCCGFLAWSCSENTSRNIAGLYYHDGEKCSLQLNADSTFHFMNVPKDIDNCFFEYRKNSFFGTWRLREDSLTLYFDSSSNCKMIILGSGNDRRIRFKTKADSDLTIDLVLTISGSDIR